MRAFASKVQLLTSAGDHLRYVPAALARAMVGAGAAGAEAALQNGRIRAVRLLTVATTHAERIGPPSDGRAMGVRFTRREMLEESGARVWQHHWRATDYD